MKISIVCVGRLKEKYWTAAVDEYSKRLGKYIKLDITELPDEKAPESMSVAQERQVKEKEGERILKAIKDDAFVVTLEIEGKQLTSVELAGFISEKMTRGVSHIAFVIGVLWGFRTKLSKKAIII